MSSEIDTVLAWRSPAGPARSMSSPYVVEVQESYGLPCCSHQSARPLPESGKRPLHHLDRGDAPGPAGGGEDAAPADDAAFLLGRVEQDERGVRDADDRGQGRRVRVVDHHGAGLGVDPLAQPGGVAGQRQGSGGARLHDPTAVTAVARRSSATATRADRQPTR